MDSGQWAMDTSALWTLFTMQTKHARNMLDFMLFAGSTGEQQQQPQQQQQQCQHPVLERITLPRPVQQRPIWPVADGANKQANKRGKSTIVAVALH